jgi:phospholipase/carboxylesterase
MRLNLHDQRLIQIGSQSAPKISFLPCPLPPMSLEAISLPPSSPAQPPPKALLVMLHGWGANSQDVAALASYLDLPGFQCFFPNGPLPFPYSPEGRIWYDLPETYSFLNPLSPDQQAQLQTSRQKLIDWLKSLEAVTGVPLSHTVLAGFSQGGAMTLEVGLELPLAALMVLSGYAHRQLELAPDAPRPKILMVHGQFDQVVPLRASHQARDRLLELGAQLRYHELNMGHEIQPIVLKLMQSFMEETVFPLNSP